MKAQARSSGQPEGPRRIAGGTQVSEEDELSQQAEREPYLGADDDCSAIQRALILPGRGEEESGTRRTTASDKRI